MEQKRLRLEWKAETEGTFRAVFATFNTIDHDGDLTKPGAFTKGQPVRIAQWGHDWSKPVIGRGVIDADDEQVWVDGELFLNTTHGRDHYETIKGLGDLQEWSYGFDVDKWSVEEREGRQVRILEAINVHEVSPVMLGAGIGTHTVAMKEQKADQDYPHHEIGEDDLPGAVDLREVARQMGIINGSNEPDAQAYAHLAKHLRDAGIEPAELRVKSAGTYGDHAYQMLTHLVAFSERTKGVRDLRAKSGRTLSAATRTQLTSALEAIRGLSSVGDEIEKLLNESDVRDDSKAADLMRARIRLSELTAHSLNGG